MKKYLNWLSRAVKGWAESVRGRVEAAKWFSDAARWVRGIANRSASAKKKPPEVKNVLLQTYFTSLLSLVLCVGMFFGTTYAWFTSEVSNTSNEIYIGILEVEMEKQDKQNAENWISLSGADSEGKIHTLFDGTIRWKPGYTAMETIRVTNKGDLAFNYVLNFTDGSVKAPEGIEDEDAWSLKDVAKYFDVWVYDHGTEDNANPAAYAEITAENSGWVNAGTLDKILDGKIVLTGEMGTNPIEAQQTETPAHTYTIALHMNDGADDAVMGYRISLSVKLTAYQMVSETDDIENSEYDGIAAVSNAEGLETALSTGGNVLLTTDVELKDAADRVTMSGGTLDGNGNTITYSGEMVGNNSAGVVTTTGGTVRNLTIKGEENGRALYVTELKSDLVVSNCTLSGAYSFNLNSSQATKCSLYFTNTTFEDWTSYANVMERAYFEGCTFEDTLRPYGDTTLTNCKFEGEGAKLDVSKLQNNESITLNNCTIGEKTGINAVLKAVDGRITVESGSNLITIVNNKIVLLSSQS